MKKSSIFKNIKKYLAEICRTKVSSHTLALGFAVGTFIAILPKPGFGLVFSLLLLLVFKKLHKLALLFPFAVWNPLILAPLYLLSYKIGELVFDIATIDGMEATLICKALWAFKSYLFGTLVLALPISLISYFVVLKVANLYLCRQKNGALASRTDKVSSAPNHRREV